MRIGSNTGIRSTTSLRIYAAPEAWRESLARLVAGVKVPVLVGGGVSVHEHDIIVAAGAIALGDDIAAGVRRLNDSIGRQEKKS